MAKCVYVSKKNTIIETGGMNNRVTFYDRNISVPRGGSTQHGEVLSNEKKIWVNLSATKGMRFFDSINLTDGTTHVAKMRYLITYPITAEKWMQYNGYNYKVLNVLNLDGDNRFLFVELKILGDQNDAVTLA